LIDKDTDGEGNQIEEIVHEDAHVQFQFETEGEHKEEEPLISDRKAHNTSMNQSY